MNLGMNVRAEALPGWSTRFCSPASGELAMSSFSFRHQARTLRHNLGSIDCLAQVRAAVDLIRHQEDRADLLVTLKVIATRLGADAAYYASVFRPEHAPASYRYLFACDPPWIQAYEALDAKTDDPWLRYALQHPAPVRARDIPIKSEREKAVVELADRHGFRSAAVLPLSLVSLRNRSGVLVIGSDVGGYFDDDEFTTSMIVARSMAMEFHERNAVVERREWLLSVQRRCTWTKHLTALLRRGADTCSGPSFTSFRCKCSHRCSHGVPKKKWVSSSSLLTH
jgi:hypothetical protein